MTIVLRAAEINKTYGRVNAKIDVDLDSRSSPKRSALPSMVLLIEGRAPPLQSAPAGYSQSRISEGRKIYLRPALERSSFNMYTPWFLSEM
jgi:hypothetical protein